jgi:hypothetical protein
MNANSIMHNKNKIVSYFNLTIIKKKLTIIILVIVYILQFESKKVSTIFNKIFINNFKNN